MNEKVANREGTLKEHKGALESYCKNCKSLLGLDFAPTDRDSTILQMTAIDPDDREKTFECELSHSAKEGEKQFTGENTSHFHRGRAEDHWNFLIVRCYLSYMFSGKTKIISLITVPHIMPRQEVGPICINEMTLKYFSQTLQPVSSG